MANELEDLKVFSKSLEEENSKLHIQAGQLEKEQQFLSIQVDNLQEENKKLLLEKESSKSKIKELFTKKDKMKSQLCAYENLISCKDAALNEKAKLAEELTVTLDEYRVVVQELKLEVSRLQDHLCQSYQNLQMLPRDSLQNAKICLWTPAQPLCTEIEESQKQEFGEEADLPSPLCGVLPTLGTHSVAEGDTRTLAEKLERDTSAADDTTKAFLQRTHSLSHLNLVTDAKLILKNQECNQQLQHLPSEMVGSMEEPKQNSEHIGNNKVIGMAPNNKMWTCSSNMETQVVCSTFQEIPVFSSAELNPEAALQWQALVPVHGELTPTIEKKPNDNSFEILLPRFLDVHLGCLLLLHILQKLAIAGLLLACVSLLAVFCFILPYSQHPVWIELKGNTWLHLQLQYLQPPPI